MRRKKKNLRKCSECLGLDNGNGVCGTGRKDKEVWDCVGFHDINDRAEYDRIWNKIKEVKINE